MGTTEWTNLLEALIWVFAPVINLLTAFVLAGGILGGALALGLNMVQHRRRKTPSI